jgi:nicotinate phosphoribosyltransferase
MDSLPSGLLTDLYQLNMIQAYLESGQTDTAVFEFFVRKLPPPCCGRPVSCVVPEG